MSFSAYASISPFENGSLLNWRLPLALAIGLHLLTFILLIFPPTFLLPDRNLDDIQTINLFTVTEFEQKTSPPPSAPRQPPTPQKVAEPPPAENVKSIATETPPATQPTTAPTQAISLSPRKLKKRVAKENKPEPTPTREEMLREQALARIQARVNQVAEDQKLKHELSRLRESLHNSEQSQASPQPAQSSASQQGPSNSSSQTAQGQGASARMNEAERRYLIAVQRRILDNWALPKTQDWDANLQAIVVIFIEKNGIISKTLFEQKSNNVYFDQYVEKTIQASAPMPPIPSDSKKDRLEVGLRFKPSGLF